MMLTIVLSILGMIFMTIMACYNVAHWKPYSWITLSVDVLCIVMYVWMLLSAIKRRMEVRKHMCDCCGGELVAPKKMEDQGLAALFQEVSIFRAKAVYKITQFTLHLPFGMSHRDLEICDKCMTDFKEFVQRKSTYMSGEKK